MSEKTWFAHYSMCFQPWSDTFCALRIEGFVSFQRTQKALVVCFVGMGVFVHSYFSGRKWKWKFVSAYAFTAQVVVSRGEFMELRARNDLEGLS